MSKVLLGRRLVAADVLAGAPTSGLQFRLMSNRAVRFVLSITGTPTAPASEPASAAIDIDPVILPGLVTTPALTGDRRGTYMGPNFGDMPLPLLVSVSVE